MPKAVCMLAPPILVALLCSAALPAEESKPPSYKGPVTGEYRSTFHPLADIPEQEPNGSAAEAQFVGCGNSLNPASLANTPAAQRRLYLLDAASAARATYVFRCP